MQSVEIIDGVFDPYDHMLCRQIQQQGVAGYMTTFVNGDWKRDSGCRDHHPHGFSIWLAGAGIKRGVIHGKTDELGFHAVEDAHYVTDIHATVLHLLGLDSHRLNIPGRKRLEVDYGNVISSILT